MVDFDVGNLPEVKKMLEWVDQQPPPSQGRDTHVIRFLLQEETPGVTTPAQYRGLMVFRPRNTMSGPVAQFGGFTATGTIANKNIASDGPVWVRVEVFFRPRPPERANVFATLRFMRDEVGGGLPSTTVRNPEVDARLVSPEGSAITLESPPERWTLGTLRRTTLLFGPPPP